MLMNKTEMRMLRWIQGVSLREQKINKEIREAATVRPITSHLMQKRLRWYEHVRRIYDSHMTRTVLDMEVEGVRQRGRPKLYGHHQKRHEEEWADGRQHSCSEQVKQVTKYVRGKTNRAWAEGTWETKWDITRCRLIIKIIHPYPIKQTHMTRSSTTLASAPVYELAMAGLNPT